MNDNEKRCPHAVNTFGFFEVNFIFIIETHSAAPFPKKSQMRNKNLTTVIYDREGAGTIKNLNI